MSQNWDIRAAFDRIRDLSYSIARMRLYKFLIFAGFLLGAQAASAQSLYFKLEAEGEKKERLELFDISFTSKDDSSIAFEKPADSKKLTSSQFEVPSTPIEPQKNPNAKDECGCGESFTI